MPDVVDYRFAQAIERILETEYAPGGLRMGISNVASGLGVSRSTVYDWLHGKNSIRFETVSRFIEEKSWRGVLARHVYEIYADHRRWKMESLRKKLSSRKL